MNDTGNKNRAVESECGPFHLSQLRGAQSIVFTKAPYLLSAASVAGSKEAQGPLGKYFDLTNEDDLFGAETWEEAESNMQKEACVLALGKSHVDPKSVRYLFGGDLLRQGIATSMGVEDLQIPIFGLYGACSTSGGTGISSNECGSRIRRLHAGSNIQPFRKCRERISISVRICEPETTFRTLDRDSQWGFPCRKPSE